MMTSLSRLEPDVMAARLALYAQLIDGVPEEMATLVDVIFEHLEGGPPVDEQEPWAHVTDHARHVVPAVMADPRVDPVLDALAVEHQRLVDANPQDFSPSKVGALVVVVVVVVVAETIHACVEGPHPEPGMSAKVLC